MTALLILILSLSLSQIKSEDFCSFIKPDGNYEGMTVYRKYSSFENSKIFIVNKRGLEYELELNVTERRVKVKEETGNVTDPQIVHRIGFNMDSDPIVKIYYNCWTKNSRIRELVCEGYEWKGGRNVSLKGTFDELKRDSVLFYPFGVKDSDRHNIGILNMKRPRITYIEFFAEVILPVDDCNECSKHSFIDRLDDSLINDLESILDFNLGEEKSRHGFVLFYNIEGQPNYCFQSSDKSDSFCSQTQNMNKLLEQCFPTPSKTSFLLIVIIAVVIGLTIVVIVGVICFIRYKRKSETTFTESKTTSKRISKRR